MKIINLNYKWKYKNVIKILTGISLLATFIKKVININFLKKFKVNKKII